MSPLSRTIAVVVALWIAASWWVVAVHPLAGPVLFTVTETNGLHLGDVPAVALAAATTAYCSRRRRMTAKASPSTPRRRPPRRTHNRRTPPGEPNSARRPDQVARNSAFGFRLLQ
jgi:hypothetical protein